MFTNEITFTFYTLIAYFIMIAYIFTAACYTYIFIIAVNAQFRSITF